MPLAGFGPTIAAFERAKTVQALDRAATVIGIGSSCDKIIMKIRSNPRNFVSVMNLLHESDALYNLHFYIWNSK
jgi:hypothetical protein